MKKHPWFMKLPESHPARTDRECVNDQLRTGLSEIRSQVPKTKKQSKKQRTYESIGDMLLAHELRKAEA